MTRTLAPGMLDAAAAGGGTELAVAGLDPGGWRLRWVDDRSGAVVGEAAARGPTVTATSPPFDRHLAFVLTPEERSPGGARG